MKHSSTKLILVALLFMAPVMAAAKENAPAKYNAVEVKHLTKVDGIDVPAEYLNGVYDRLREDLAKTGIFGTVVEDGGTITDPGAVLLECKIIKFSKDSSAIGEVLEEVTLLSRGDHRLIKQFTTVETPVNIASWEIMARATGHYLADQIRRNLK